MLDEAVPAAGDQNPADLGQSPRRIRNRAEAQSADDRIEGPIVEGKSLCRRFHCTGLDDDISDTCGFLAHLLEQSGIHMGIRLDKDQRGDGRRIMTEVVSVPRRYLERSATRRGKGTGADLTQTCVLYRAQHAVVEGGDDRVTGHMSMIDNPADAANGGGIPR